MSTQQSASSTIKQVVSKLTGKQQPRINDGSGFKSQTLRRYFDERRERGLKVQLRVNAPHLNHQQRRAILTARTRQIRRALRWGKDSVHDVPAEKLPTDIQRRGRRWFEAYCPGTKSQVRELMMRSRRVVRNPQAWVRFLIRCSVTEPAPVPTPAAIAPPAEKDTRPRYKRLFGRKDAR